MEVSTHFYMLTGLNEFCQKSFQFSVPLNKVGEVTLQILLSKRKEHISILKNLIFRRTAEKWIYFQDLNVVVTQV